MLRRNLFNAVVVALVSSAETFAQTSREADSAAVSAAMDVGADALKRRDWAAYTQFWANRPDIEVMHPASREWLIGWDTIATKYRGVISDTSAQYSFTTLRRNVHISPAGDMAWGTDETRISVTRGSRTTAVLQWSTYVFERQDGKWRLVHAHASVPPRPPSSTPSR
jgi:ketosteroid isomerase-like protein